MNAVHTTYEYITTEKELVTVLNNELIPYFKKGNCIVALDLETYITSTMGANGEEEDSKVKNIVPRPILKKDGTFTGQIKTLQLGLDPNNPLSIGGKQFIFDVQKLTYPVVTKYLKHFIEASYILGHNLKYDYQFLYSLLSIYPKKMYDTMLISQVLYAGDLKRHGLADLYSHLLDYSWFLNNMKMPFDAYKEFKKKCQVDVWSNNLSEEQLKYAADDVYLIFYCFEEMRKALNEWEKKYERHFDKDTGIKSVIKLECKLIPVFALMELRGIHIDMDYHSNHVIKVLQIEKDRAYAEVDLTRTIEVKKTNGKYGKERLIWFESITEKINLNSPAQLKPALETILREDLGEDLVLEGTAEAVLSRFLNDRDIFTKLSEKTKNTLLAVLRYKKASSLLSKFGQKTIDSCTDRSYIHPSWFAIGSDENSVATGRSSCKNINIQQIPSRGSLFKSAENPNGYGVTDLFRTAFNADDGYVIVCADYSQIEARVAAAACGEKDLVRRFNAGTIDIYGAIAKAMMNLDFEPSKDDPREEVAYLRNYIGKTAGLSMLYGTHWRSLGKFMFDKTEGKVNWSDDEAKEAYENFFTNFQNFRIAMRAYNAEVKRLPEEAGQTLYPFRQRRNGNLVPYFVAFSKFGLKRPRRFTLKPEHLRLDQFGLSSRAEKRIKEDGTEERSNAYYERVSSASREGFNHEIQSASANVLKLAALKIHYAFVEAGFDWKEGIAALVHDEVLCHVLEEHAEQAKEIVERCMKEAAEELIPQVSIPAKAKIAKNWALSK